MKQIRRFAPLIAAFLAVTLAACASNGGAKTAPPAGAKSAAKTGTKTARGTSPEDRAVERWQYLIEGHFDLAYDYMTPGARSAKSREAWAKEFADRPVRWTKAGYMDKYCESDDACQVRIQVEYKAPLQGAPGGAMSAPGILTEHWIRIDGIWYFLPDALVSGGLH